MSKYEVLVSAEKITFVDSKGKSEGFELLDKMDDGEAVNAIKHEQNAARKASVAAISLLCEILNNPRIDGYKGKTPALEPVLPELKAAIRELETEYIKPIFCKPLLEKGMKLATVETQWQEYSRGLKDGGSYANAKSACTQYFAICGKLPQVDNGKLLSIAAIKKLVQQSKDDAGKPEPKTIADKLVELNALMNNRTDKTEIGSPVVALIALNELLATFTVLNQEAADAAAVTYEHQIVGDVAGKANAAISNAAKLTEPALV